MLLGLLTAMLAALAAQSMVLGIIGAGLALVIAVVCVFGASAVGYACLVAGGFFSPMDNLRPPGGGLFTVGDVFYLLAILLLVPTRLTRRVEFPSGFAVGIGGLLAMTMLTTLASSNFGDSLLTSFRLSFAVFLLPVTVALFRPSLVQIDRLAWAYILGQVFNTAYAVTLGGEGQGRLIGLTQHPNYLGLDGAFGCALALYLAIRPGKQYDAQRLYAWGAGAICLASVVLSGSRTAIIAVLAIAIFYPIVERSLMALYILVAGAIVVAISFAFLVAALGPGSAIVRILPGNKSAQFSDEDRSQLFSAHWAVFRRHPIFGRGFRADDFFAHNALLEIAMAVGLVGLAFFILMGWSLVRVLFSGGRLHALGYTALAYASMTPTTPSIWDRNIWGAMMLAVLATGARNMRPAESRSELISTPPTPFGTRSQAEFERHR